MATLNQEAVINKIKKKVGKGRIVIGREMKGIYADSVVKNPKKLTESKGYKEKMKPVIEQLQNERLEALEEARKKRGTAQYAQLMQAVKDLTNQIQLLGGGDTERIRVIEVSSSGVKKYGIDASTG